MLLLASTTDKIQLTTSSAGAVDVHASFVDFAASVSTPGRKNTAITTASTTDIVLAPAASTIRNIKHLSVVNKSGASIAITVVHTDGTTAVQLWDVVLYAGEKLSYVDGVGFAVRDTEGVLRTTTIPLLNASVTDQALSAGATAVMTGGDLKLPTGRLKAGTMLRWMVVVTKTAAGTTAATWGVKFGTTGTTTDTTRVSFTGDTETAIASEAVLEIVVTLRGPISATCVAQGLWTMDDNLTTTGFSNTARKAQVRLNTSAAFDITTAGLIASPFVTAPAASVYTIRQVTAEILNLA